MTRSSPFQPPEMVWILAIALALFVGCMLLGWETAQRANQAAAQERERIRGLPLPELVEEARAHIEQNRWGYFKAARDIEFTATWSEALLRDKLLALLQELMRDDEMSGREGRDSHHFQFHDCGLRTVLEHLDRE